MELKVTQIWLPWPSQSFKLQYSHRTLLNDPFSSQILEENDELSNLPIFGCFVYKNTEKSQFKAPILHSAPRFQLIHIGKLVKMRPFSMMPSIYGHIHTHLVMIIFSCFFFILLKSVFCFISCCICIAVTQKPLPHLIRSSIRTEHYFPSVTVCRFIRAMSAKQSQIYSN